MAERRVVLVERVDFLCCVRPGSRRGRWIWFERSDVAELTRSGQKGWYEIERIRGAAPRATKWRVIGPTADPHLPR